jgi:hypothetical protein
MSPRPINSTHHIGMENTEEAATEKMLNDGQMAWQRVPAMSWGRGGGGRGVERDGERRQSVRISGVWGAV